MGALQNGGIATAIPIPWNTDRADRPLPDQVVIARARRTAASARGRAALRQRGATVERSFEACCWMRAVGGARHSRAGEYREATLPAGGGRQPRAPASKPRRSRDIAANLGRWVAFVLDCLLMRLLRSSALTFRIGLAQHISVAAFRLRSLSIGRRTAQKARFFDSLLGVQMGERRAPRRSHDRIQDGWVACHDRRRRTPGARREVRNAPGFEREDHSRRRPRHPPSTTSHSPAIR